MRPVLHLIGDEQHRLQAEHAAQTGVEQRLADGSVHGRERVVEDKDVRVRVGGSRWMANRQNEAHKIRKKIFSEFHGRKRKVRFGNKQNSASIKQYMKKKIHTTNTQP
jgi:hypothetical protein